MARKIHYSDERFNPDEFYKVSHFDEHDNCTHEYLKLSEIPGITEELIICIRQMNAEEHHNGNTNERYLVDARYKAAKTRHGDMDDETTIMDRFYYHSETCKPEGQPVIRNGFVDKVHSLLHLLTVNQQKLYELLKEGFSLQEIANIEGTTKDAIASRKRKLHTRLYKLYEEHFGNS